MQESMTSPRSDQEPAAVSQHVAGLKWVGVSLAATLVACHASFWLAYFIVFRFPMQTVTTFHLANGAVGAVGGLLLGAIQFLLVRRTGIKPGPWLLVSGLGGALGGVVCSLYSLGISELPARNFNAWWARVLLWVVPGGLWASLVGATQLGAFRGRLTRRTSWAAALLTMIIAGSAVSLEHGILVVERAMRNIEF